MRTLSKYILAVLLLSGCTKLDEQTFGNLSPTTYYVDESTALSSVVGVYSQLSLVVGINDPWRVGEFSTDEFLVPGRASGGWFDQGQVDLIGHVPDANNDVIARAWVYLFQEIGTANAVLESLNESPNKSQFSALIAETKAMRAYGYFYAMEYWGNVPLVTTARIDPNNLPTNTPRKDIFNFVTSEMLAASNDMPSVADVNQSSYYPRFTKEAIYSALAMAYLNSEVFTGTAKWDSVIVMCDKIINTGKYALAANVGDCFSAANKGTTKEVISAFSEEPTQNAGGNQFILYTNNALDQKKYNLPFTPANGYSTTPAALNRYEDQDNRKALIEYGPQTNLDGTPLNYADGHQLVLVPVQSLTAAQDNEGYKPLKYTPVGTTWVGYNGNNDLVLMRYADVLLMKAEALFRLGQPDALELVNQVRARSNATALSSLTLKDLEDERAREFLWEGCRRRDMIRFGSYFDSTWDFKTTVTPAYMSVYPIPNAQLTSNPNLKQNDGYN